MGWEWGEGGTTVAAAGGVATPAPAIAAPRALALAFVQSLSLASRFASQPLALVSSCLCMPALARTGLVVRMVVCACGRCCCPRWRCSTPALGICVHPPFPSFVCPCTRVRSSAPALAFDRTRLRSFVHLGVCAAPRYLVVLAWPLFVLARPRPCSFVL
jgi:hypothetical protein